MAISYPVTPSSTVTCRILSMTLRLRRITAMTQSPFTGAQQVFSWGDGPWEADIAFAGSRSADGAAIAAFIASLRGQYGTFLLGPSFRIRPRGDANTSGVTVSGAGQTGNAITVTGLGAGKTMLAGDFLQLGTGSSARLYMVVEDATANGSGTATLSIEPALRSSPADGAAVALAPAKGLWRLADNAIGVTAGIAAFHEPFAFSIVEAL